MIKKLFITILAATVFFVLTQSALAAIQLDNNFRPSNLPTFNVVEEGTVDSNPETRATQTIILFAGNIVSKILLFAGAITIVFLIIAGGNYIFAFGKDERIEKGKLGVTWSLVGLVVILMSYAIVQGIIQIILKVDESAV